MKGKSHTKYHPNGAEIGKEAKDRSGLLHILVRAEVLVVGKIDLPIAVYCLLCVAFKLSYAVLYWPK